MSYPAILCAAGLMIVSAFAVAAHNPRIGANGEFSLPSSGLQLRPLDATNANGEKPATAIGLPTAPDDE
jgi:hypothetical protein